MNKIKRRLVHELAAKEIQKYIREQGFGEGDKLPSLEELASVLGVGRSSLREALRSLQAMDMIEMINGKGVYVKDTHSYRISAKVKVDDVKRSMLQVSEVRRALEGMAVELAAARATDQMIKEMEYYISEIKRYSENQMDTSELDIKFHQTIYKASDNPVLESVILSMWKMFEVFWSNPFGDNQLFEATLPIHFTLAEAIKNKDGQKARAEFNKLMDAVEATIHEAE
ncbi:FadR/GntR family transcriptional regulator [Paenibacillus abyssi]|uniref:GntR family transcriptional regulator n=1 Tax=Paenibacillus abyssi TaxID=1340531 RepID=A0A917LF07_9BACL|nr:FadR/GntR family transcriptional regulator [Paenibacillus abyssi]GGG16525.1 GntR family transcriptional regulator [Paenibacillus abyssi]